MAYSHADLCPHSPESSTLEEKKRVCNDMAATSMAQLDTVRKDFESLPTEVRSKFLDMLRQSDAEPSEWMGCLAGEGDPFTATGAA